MRGVPSFNYPAFHAADKRFQALGWDVLNPAEMTERIDGFDPDGDKPHMPFEHVMRRDLGSVSSVDAIALLPSWEKSEGAKLEVLLAQALRLEFYHAETMKPLVALPRVHVACQGAPGSAVVDPGAVRQAVRRILTGEAVVMTQGWQEREVDLICAVVARALKERVVDAQSGEELKEVADLEIRVGPQQWSTDPETPDLLPEVILDGYQLSDVRRDSASEFEAVRALHEEAMAPSIDVVMGWDRQFQAERMKRHWNEGNLKWITDVSSGRRVGVIDASVQPDGRLYVNRFYLGPEARGQGLGSRILGSILKRADEAGVDSYLSTMLGSRAGNLYRRLGYQHVRDDQYQDHYERSAETRDLPVQSFSSLKAEMIEVAQGKRAAPENASAPTRDSDSTVPARKSRR